VLTGQKAGGTVPAWPKGDRAGGTGATADVDRSSRGDRAVTIRDVAAAAGVSHQTIANVIKSPERVAPATRELVEYHIQQLGFRPNRMAQNLSNRRSRLIGFRVQARSALATGGILDAFLHSLAEGAEEIDHHIVLFSSPPGMSEVEKAAAMYRESIADAFVVAETEPGDPRIDALVAAKLKFVSFGRTDSAMPHHWVDTDNVVGSRLAVRHLLDVGHRAIGFLGWPGESWVGDDRAAGWHAELAAAGLPHPDDSVARAVNDRQVGAVAAEALLRSRPDLTAVVAVSDELALGVMAAAERLGRSVAVVGYDDSPMALQGDGLTTIHQPIPAIARRILAITARLIAGEQLEPIQERIAPHLVVRASSPPPG
jgi:DNA-binding LacI/PurR family transcriptional regulator